MGKKVTERDRTAKIKLPLMRSAVLNLNCVPGVWG